MNPAADRIRELKLKRNAIILVHNYQPPEIQDIADFLGDSLGLSQRAAATDCEVVVFCGVNFMAETASILSPHKTVIVPEPKAGCPMANMIDAGGVRKLRDEHPGAEVVTYVNSTAEVKAESDYCCTSANASSIVASIDPGKEVVFIPDQHLGDHVSAVTGRKLVLWPGYCATHMRILPEDVIAAKSAHPKAEVLAHPECRRDVVDLADAVLSTSGMCRHPDKSASSEFIIATELGLLHQLRKLHPDRLFVPATERAVCPNMKMNTLEKVILALEDMKHEVRVPEPVRVRAKKAVDRMLSVGRRE